MVLALAACLGACDAPVTRPDDAGLDASLPSGDAGSDAGPRAPDGGAAAGLDSGVELDGGADAGQALDAGFDAGSDAGLALDAGVDAGAFDAGGDAGVGVDAGLDAGPELDAGPPNAVIAVDLAHPGAAVPDDFLGLSVEWSHVPDYLSDGSGQPRATVVQLLNNFAADGHHPLLRIGGNSEDRAFWNPAGQPLPAGATVSLDAAHLSILSALHAAAGTRFILGLNLARNDPANAAALVQAASAALGAGAVEAFELGNEPDLYFPNGYRPFYYSPLGYQADFDGYFPQLSTAASNQALFAAPAVYGTAWLTGLGSFLTAERGRLRLVTVHRYPLNVCLTSVGIAIPSLFTAAATTGYATDFATPVQTAAQAGLALRVAEMNSISCGGLAGVSDVFAAGLWGLDAMFQLASIGASGVNLHTPSRYAVFDYDAAGALQVRGLYYAMLLFSRATAAQGRLLPVTVTSQLQVRAWATLGSDGVVRVAIVNEDLAQPAAVSLTVPPRTAQAWQWQLTAPALTSTTAISFGAQTFEGSVDGTASGPAGGAPVGGGGGAYRLALGPGSAAVLVVPR